MAKFKIQTDDTVIVTTGKHKGETGRVVSVDNESGRVLIEQVNLVTRQVKPQGDAQVVRSRRKPRFTFLTCPFSTLKKAAR